MQVLSSLLSGLKAVCSTFPDTRKGRGGNIEIADFGLSAFAMFFMQSASFLAFQRALEKGQGRSNGQTLFGIGRIPSDNYIRDTLDEADPTLVRPRFERIETLLAGPALRQAFGRLGGRTLIAWDGTEYFRSQKLACPNCLTRKRSNGKAESDHSLLSATVVAPGHSKVIPLMPELVATQDGAEKQDCERNAVKRWLSAHGARLAPLRPIFLGDDLFAPRRQDDRGWRRRFHLRRQGKLAQGALRLHQRIGACPPRGESAPPRHERDVPLSLDRGDSNPRRQGRPTRQLDRIRDRRRSPKSSRLPSLPVSQVFPSPKTTSPKSSPVAARDGKSRTKASTS